MKKKNFKLLSIVIILMTMIFVLSACNGPYLSDNFDENQVEAKAEKVIALLIIKGTEKIRDMSTEELKHALTDGVFVQIYEDVQKVGNFKQVKDISVSGSVDKKTKEEFAVVTAKAGYKKGDLIYTISFNKDLELVGLYYRK